jgi:hypothetical protein
MSFKNVLVFERIICQAHRFHVMKKYIIIDFLGAGYHLDGLVITIGATENLVRGGGG